MSRLPRDALANTTPEQRRQEEWKVSDELLALIAEIASVTASGQQLKKPIKVPRPKHIRRAGRTYQHADNAVSGANAAGPDPYKRGVSVLARTTRGKVLRS